MNKCYLAIFLFIFLFFSFRSYSSPLFPANLIVDNDSASKELVVKKIYPNPVLDKMTVEYTIQTAGELIVRIYDILGNEVMKKDFVVENEGLNRIIFDLSELRPGIYIMKTIKNQDAVAVRIKKQ